LEAKHGTEEAELCKGLMIPNFLAHPALPLDPLEGMPAAHRTKFYSNGK